MIPFANAFWLTGGTNVPAPVNLVINPGAETGNINGWVALVGDPLAATTGYSTINARSGAYYFGAGTVSRTVLRQTIAIPVKHHSDIDANLGICNVDYWTAHQPGEISSVNLQFLNSGGIVIGCHVPAYDSNGLAWVNVNRSVRAPVGTRSVTIELMGCEGNPTQNDCYHDDIKLWFSTAVTPFPVELAINNPDADVGSIAGWTIGTGNPATTATSGAGTLPRSGRNYFYPGTTASSTMRQDVTIPTIAHANIDAGLAQLDWDYYQQAPADADAQRIHVEFFSAAMGLLGSSVPPATSDGTAPFNWVYKTHTAPIPVNTRIIRIINTGARVTGTSNDGYSAAYRACIRL